MKKVISSIAALGLIVTSVTAIGYWEFYLKERLNTEEVVVAAKKLEPRHMITTEDLVIERRDVNSLPPDSITKDHLNDLLNEEVLGVIDVKDVFTANKLVQDVAPKENEKIYPIPSEWIEAVPGSLRRSDKVTLYALVKAKVQDIKGEVNVQAESKSQQIKDDVNFKVDVKKVDYSIDKPILKDIAVAYVKDSSNSEVKAKETVDESNREDLTANPHQLELIMTDEQFQQLKKVVEDGYKLLFAY